MSNLGPKAFSLISVLASVSGLVMQLVGGWADEKKLDQTIDEKVHEAVIKKTMMENQNPIGFTDTQKIEEP